MKLIPPVLLTFFAAALALSQNEPSGVSIETSASATTARVLGEIPDGTPPQPTPPKPEFVVRKRDILKTATHEQGGRTITIQQIKPITLPQPPQPAETIVGEVDAAFSQRLAEYREAHPENELLVLGATVFRSKDSPPPA